MLDTLLAKVFTIFAQFMVKMQPIWDRFKVLISIGVGVIIGLIIGWGILPVKWVNAPPSLLREDYRTVYLAKVAEDHAISGDMEMTRRKLGMDEELGSGPWQDKPETLAVDIQYAIDNAERFGVGDKIPALERFQPDADQFQPAIQPPTAPGLLTIAIRFLATLLAITLVATAIWYLLVGRKKREEEIGEPSEDGGSLVEELGIGAEQPSSVKTYTYVLGDDYFDPSFSIEIGPDFYGECGIGITETIGAGDPKKVTAFETWLFDKSDIKTVTTIIGSEFAMTDADLNEKLQPKREGDELLPIEPGMEIALETTALRIKARITELEYAQGNLPANSFFQKVTFELQAWVKQVEQSA